MTDDELQNLLKNPDLDQYDMMAELVEHFEAVGKDGWTEIPDESYAYISGEALRVWNLVIGDDMTEDMFFGILLNALSCYSQEKGQAIGPSDDRGLTAI